MYFFISILLTFGPVACSTQSEPITLTPEEEKYQKSLVLIRNHDYESARNILHEIGGYYKDSRKLILFTNANIFVQKMYNSELSETDRINSNELALSVLSEIKDGDLKEFQKDIDELRKKVNYESVYIKAKGYFEKKQYDAAVDYFNKIPGYKDSNRMYKLSQVFKLIKDEKIYSHVDRNNFKSELAKINITSDEYGEYAAEISTSIDEILKKEEWPQLQKAKSGVRIGMTKAEVLESSWGKPQHVNKTTTSYGTSEQWVYGINSYLYFEDGILTAIQN